jgi:nitric oxide reductase activation protein
MFVVKSRSILADNAGARKIPRQRSGKWLDESRLGLVRAGETRIFQRQQKKQFHDYRIGLLVDTSGSMTGTKLVTACKATHALEYALMRAGAHTEVYTFNGEWLDIPTADVRDYDKFYRRAYESMHRWGGDNNDADAVRIATKKLSMRQEPGKILLVLSDGQPAPGGGPIMQTLKKMGLKDRDADDSRQDLKQAIVEAREQGITTLAVGILTEDPVAYYGEMHTAVVHKISDLYSAMAKILEKNIQRG